MQTVSARVSVLGGLVLGLVAPAGVGQESQRATRRAESRPEKVEKFGGHLGGHRGLAKYNKPTADAIVAGLGWLRRHQDPDGRWDADEFMKHDPAADRSRGPGAATHDIGVTALATLAFLGDGSTPSYGAERATVARAIRWLITQQGENGLIGAGAAPDYIYDHAIATCALCEAFGMTEDETLRAPAQRAVDYLVSHRNPYAVWRYQPRDNDNDTSVTAWCLLACRAASDFQLVLDKQVFTMCLAYLDQVTDPATGRAGYTKRGEGSSRLPGEHAARFPNDKNEALTGAALFCRFFLGQAPATTPIMNLAADTIAAKPPKWNPRDGSIDFYAWYFSTYAIYQMGGRYWQNWSRTLGPALLPSQRRDGASAGSWDPEVDAWGSVGGRVGTTAFGVLTLEVHYRFTRLVR